MAEMERLCHIFRIRPDQVDIYLERHQKMPVDMRSAITEAGVSDYSLFLRGDLVIAYGRCEPDVATCLARVSMTDAAKRWGEAMDGLVLENTSQPEMMRQFLEIWHLD